MTNTSVKSVDKYPQYIHSSDLTHYLSNKQPYCLFLDIDGTLAEFTLNPKDSIIAKSTLVILEKIQSLGIPIAIVTGRSLIEAKEMLHPLQLPIAATHGLEIEFNSTVYHTSDNDKDINSCELATLKYNLTQACLACDGLTIENKPYSVALHYRQQPELADVARNIVIKLLEDYPRWTLKQGKFVWEIAPKGVNKGDAILTLLEKIQHSVHHDEMLCPIFIGDDITDEAGFMAVQGENIKDPDVGADADKVCGIGIKVGSEESCAHYYVQDVTEVAALLVSLLNFWQQALLSDSTVSNNPIKSEDATNTSDLYARTASRQII